MKSFFFTLPSFTTQLPFGKFLDSVTRLFSSLFSVRGFSFDGFPLVRSFQPKDVIISRSGAQYFRLHKRNSNFLF